ncbi:MAG: hypothetical protein ABFC91_07590 [Methanobacteriaceae archaeon]
MKYGKVLVMVFVLLFVFSFSPAYADVLEPGQKTVPIYYVLTNINEYPGYVFLLHGNPSPDFQILNSSPFTFYKFSVVSIYAVNRSQFNQAELMVTNSNQLDTYFQNDSRVLNANLQLESIYRTVSDTNPLDNVTILLEIVSLNDKGLKINKDRIIFGYNDGKTEEKSYVDQNTTPEAPPSEPGDLYWYYLLLPILAAITTLIILIYRHRYP